MSAASDIFYELLFGSGAWIGLILILSIAFLVGARNKYVNLLFIPILAFFGLLYLDNVAASANFMWSAVFCFIGSGLLVIQFAKQK